MELRGRDALAWALVATAERAPAYRLGRDYHEGRHRRVADDRTREHFGRLLRDLSDNLCAPVVDALVERLGVEGWTDETGAEHPAAGALWEASGLDMRQRQLHLDALRCGDAYALVWPGPGALAQVWPQEPTAVAVAYDDDDDPARMTRAAKVWVTGRTWRANVYHADIVERWVLPPTATTPRPGVPAPPPERPTSPDRFVPWAGDDAGPVVAHAAGEVPMVHWANGVGVGEWGRSELSNVIPLQDALNKALSDLVVAMEFVALPQRILIGYVAETDPLTGLPRRLQPGADRVWSVPDPTVRAEQFPAADLRQLLEVCERFRVEIARVSGTPAHYIGLDDSSGRQVGVPSGEALRVLEGRLTSRATDRVRAWSWPWARAMDLCLRVTGLPPGARPTWRSVQADSPSYDLELAEARLRVGWSRRAVLAAAGLGESQIARMEAERAEEQAAVGDALLRTLDGGAAL